MNMKACGCKPAIRVETVRKIPVADPVAFGKGFVCGFVAAAVVAAAAAALLWRF